LSPIHSDSVAGKPLTWETFSINTVFVVEAIIHFGL